MLEVNDTYTQYIKCPLYMKLFSTNTVSMFPLILCRSCQLTKELLLLGPFAYKEDQRGK